MAGDADHLPFQPVRPVRAYERVVQQIEEAILRGDLRPGERLPTERELMARFEVSRATIREALRVLQSAGLVRSRSGDPNGPEVMAFSTAGIRTSMGRLARLEHLTLGELVQFRMFVEGAANQLAAHLRTRAQLAAMQEALEEMERAAAGDYDAFSRADVAFHERVAEASGNKLLQVCGQVVRDVVLELISDKIAHAPDSAAMMRESIHRHRVVLHAVREGDGARAAALARQHLYEYYASYVDAAERPALETLLNKA